MNDSLQLTENQRMGNRVFFGTYNMDLNKEYSFDITVDDKRGFYTGLMPDTVALKNIGIFSYVQINQSYILEWSKVKNADFYLVDARVWSWLNDEVTDTSFVTADTSALLPSKFFTIGKTSTIRLFAVNGIVPNQSQNSNLRGDIEGQFFLYSKQNIELEGANLTGIRSKVDITQNQLLPTSVTQKIFANLIE